MSWIQIPDQIYGTFNHRLEFFCPIYPKSMERGRFKRIGNFPKPYTVPEDLAYQDLIKECFDKASMSLTDPLWYPWLGPVFLTCHFLFKKSSTWYPGKPFARSPDLDNLLKNIMDAMNAIRYKTTKKEGKIIERSLGAWADDRQVCGFYGTKSYFDLEGTLVVMDFYNKDEPPCLKTKEGPTTVEPVLITPSVVPYISREVPTLSSAPSRMQRRVPMRRRSRG